jgi:hypothetical protein
LFAANLCLVGVIVALATARSVWAILSAILLFLSSASLLEIPRWPGPSRHSYSSSCCRFCS